MTGNKTKSGNKKRKRILVCSNCHFARKAFSKNQKCPKCGKPHHVSRMRKYFGVLKHAKT